MKWRRRAGGGEGGVVKGALKLWNAVLESDRYVSIAYSSNFYLKLYVGTRGSIPRLTALLH